MLPKKLRAIQTSEFRPIASSGLSYKVFAYLILGRVEEILESKEPEEQHGFQPGRRLAAAWVRRAGQRDTRADVAAAWRAGSGSGFGEHSDEAGCLVAPPAPYFNAQDHQTTSAVV